MEKKIGKSIVIISVVAFFVLAFVIGIYATSNYIYGANTREDFSFYREADGSVRKYSLELGEATAFNLILPQGVSKDDVKITEADSSKLLSINSKNEVTGIKIGKGTLKATITVDGKTYEATTTYEITDKDFRFPLENKAIIQYIGSDAFVVGKEYTFNMKLPSGYTLDDVEFYEKSTNLLTISDVDKSVTPKSVGKGELFAHIIGTDKYTSVEFEVVDSSSNKNTSSSSNTTSSTTKTTVNQKTNYKIEFKNEVRSTTFNNANVTLGASSYTRSGINAADVVWTSSDEKVATVKDTSGRLNIKGVGTTTITASYPAGNVSDSYTLVVYPKTIDIVNNKDNKVVNGTTVTIAVGDTLKVSAKNSNTKIENNILTYTSSNGKICSIDKDGNIQALAKGRATIKTMITANNKSTGQFQINVVEDEDEAMEAGSFSFPIDTDTNKPIQLTGQKALLVGAEISFTMLKPTGAESYPVEYTCSPKNLVEINGESIRTVKAGKGTLTAKIKIGNKYKTTSTKIEIYDSLENKNKASASQVKYINVKFDKPSMAVQVGNVINLKPVVETNMLKKDYNLVYTASQEGIIELNETSGRVKPLKAGTVDVTVSVKESPDIKATITINAQEKVTLVSSLKFVTTLTKEGSVYKIPANEPVTMEFEVSPSSATSKEYSLEVADDENFIVAGKTVTALKAGAKTKLTAIAADSGSKKTTITIESTLSSKELSSLIPILNNKEININVGDTVTFKNVDNVSQKVTVSRVGQYNFDLKSDVDTITITGKKEGTANLVIKYGQEKITIPVNVSLASTKATNKTNTNVASDTNNKNNNSNTNLNVTNNGEVVTPVTDIILPIDQATAQVKDYVTDNPLQTGVYYRLDTKVLPETASNKDLNYTINNAAYTVTEDGSIVVDKPDEKATLTISSVSNPEVSETVQLFSVSSQIKSIKFPRQYTGEYAFNVNDGTGPWQFGMIITTTDNHTYNPLTNYNEVINDPEYLRLRDQIVIESSDSNILRIQNNIAYTVDGVNGKGTLTAYVRNNANIRTSTNFEAIGTDKNVKISEVKFAAREYELSVEEKEMGFCPIITLSDGTRFDSTKESVRKSAEYKGYLSQLQLIKIDKIKSKTKNSTGELVSIADNDKELIVQIGWAGECALGVGLKGSNKVLDSTKLIISDTNKQAEDNLKAKVEKIDRATTTDNKNLKIADIQFAHSSYTLDENYGWAFNPIITLSDGTKIDSSSSNQDVYKYYVGLTELFHINRNTNKIDFGIVDIDGNTVTPLKNGTVTLCFGVKSTKVRYGTSQITVNI